MRLAQGEATVTELAEPFEISLPAISRHLRVLEETGLMGRTKDGRVHHCRLLAEPMRDAIEWIARYGRFWELNLDALGEHLGGSPAGKDG
jgi:DNA-binding transcriptional ArsR family regulator